MDMYFQNRSEAGILLARKLAEDLRGQPCAVVALSEGGVVVGAQIARELECVLTLLLVEPIELPGEIDPIGTLSENGSFAYNNMYAPGEIEELMMDYRAFVEDEKRTRLSQMHRLVGGEDSMRIELLQHKNVILVTDGFSTGYAMDIAAEVLKPVAARRIIAAAPLMSAGAADRVRLMCDRMYYLSLVANYLATDHYYEEHDVPDRESVVKIVQHVVHDWQQ